MIYSGIFIVFILVILIFFFLIHRNNSPDKNTISQNNNFRLIIEKINIDVPVIENVNGIDKSIYNEALENGVAHYKGTSLPGQKGNIFIFGHSGGNELLLGKYASAFSSLENLEDSDSIKIIYQDKTYLYKIFAKEVVQKNNIEVLDQVDENQLTLMTCWPIGSNEKRLVIKSELEIIDDDIKD